MKQKLILIALFLCFTLNACGPRMVTFPLEDLEIKNQKQDAYQVRRGDILSVKVWGEDRLSGDVAVRNDGRFTMTLINEVDAEGKNLEQIKEDVTKKLATYVPTAEVSVSLSRPAPIRYFLSGLFSRPGAYTSESRLTLIQGIATGGDFQPFANRSSITLIRKIGLEERRYVLNYDKVASGEQPNPEIHDGDTLIAK